MKTTIYFILLFTLSIPSFAAWDKVVTGKIKQIDVEVANGDNAGFRVLLEDTAEMCSNGRTWAYINKSNDNYQTAVSMLLAAKMADKTVTLYNNIGSWGEHCHIGYAVLR